MNLNEVAQNALENAKRREANGAKIDYHTFPMLKHCATEVVEATEAFYPYKKLSDETKSGKDFSKHAIPNRTESQYNEYREKFASELADIICCTLIIGANEGIDIEEAVCKCMLKNAKRAYGDGDKL